MNELSNLDLNCWLAEHLFGFEWWRSSATGRRGLFPPDKVPEWFHERADGTEKTCHDHPSHVPKYSENIQDAWKVWEKMRELGWLVVVKDMPEGYPFIVEDSNADLKVMRRSCADFRWMPNKTIEDTLKKIHTHCFVVADTPWRAICEAAKKAIEQNIGD